VKQRATPRVSAAAVSYAEWLCTLVLKEPVAELGDVPSQQEPDRDPLVEHLLVAAEVVRDIRGV
jgi:hypothetical protein